VASCRSGICSTPPVGHDTYVSYMDINLWACADLPRSAFISIRLADGLVALPGQSGRYELLETRKDGTKFTSEALRQAATQLQTFSGQYESRQGHLVEQVDTARACTWFISIS
jgi:hypothetical protein